MMMNQFNYQKRFGQILIVFATVSLLDCAKIVLFTPPVNRGSKSHRHIMTNLGETLASSGHEVTMLLQGVERTDSKLLKTIHAPSPYDQVFFDELEEDIKQISASVETGKVAEKAHNKFQTLIETECRTLLGDESLFAKLEKENFDLAIVDHYYNCGFVAAAKLKLKYVILECSSAVSLQMDVPGASSPLSYVPAFMSGLTDEMGFLGRMKNLFMCGATSFFFQSWMKPWEAITVEFGPEGRSLKELKSDGELWLINNDFSLEYPRPLLPNTIFIGGSLARPANPLPKDILEFIEGSSDGGIILVSFGSVIDLTQAPNLARVLIESLGSLGHRVMWAAKSRPIDQTIPGNIKFWDWIPQNDILGHPGVKAFITHGGINGVWEAIYHAVPTLIIPGTMDASDNALRLEKKGMALIEPPIGITVEPLTAKLKRLINEKSFKINAKRASEVMRNQPQTPAQRITFWVNYVLNFNGADHLKNAAANLSFYQYYMLDVYGFLAFVSIFSIFIARAICSFCCRRCKRCCKSKAKQQ